MNIVIADDESPLLNFLARGLRAEGYECTPVSNLHEVITTIKVKQPSVLILDRLFGNEDSLSILDSIKALPSAPMILLLTALDEINERVKGLQQGADDYLCKPFDFDELLARVVALARRHQASEPTGNHLLMLGSIEINTEQRIATVDDAEVDLTKIEYELLLYLGENRNKVLSRERILSRVWQTQSDPHTNIVDVYISRLRRKFQSLDNISIQTLRGNGYRLNIGSPSD